MKIVPVYDKNIYIFQGLLPSHLIRGAMQFYGCIEGEEPLGVAALEHYQHGNQIAWLYVSPEHRGIGAGAMLLDKISEESKGEKLEFFYDNTGNSAWDLTGMLMRRGFVVTTQRYGHYRAGVELLRNSPARTDQRLDAQKASFVPISEISPIRFRRLINKYEQAGAFHVSRADYAGCDEKLSLICIRDEKIAGMMLVKDLGSGVLELVLMYLSEEYRTGGLSMIRMEIEHVLKNVPELKELRFTCMTETVEKIADKMIPGAEKSWIEIYHAKRD